MKWLAALFLAGVVFWGGYAHAIDPQSQQPPRRTDDVTEPAASVRSTAPPAPSASASSGLWFLAQNQEAVWLADPAQVSRRGATARAWITMVYREPTSNGVKYTTALTEFDCQSQTIRDLAGAFYDSSGRVLHEISETSAEYVIPGSVGASLLTVSCGDSSQWSSSLSPVPSGLTVVQAANNWFRSQPPPPFTASSFVGGWETDGDCSKATEFFANGTVREPGFTGRWSFAGNRLTMQVSDGQQVTLTVEPIDSRQFRYSGPDGMSGLMRRCY
jgi:hypothetical protein